MLQGVCTFLVAPLQQSILTQRAPIVAGKPGSVVATSREKAGMGEGGAKSYASRVLVGKRDDVVLVYARSTSSSSPGLTDYSHVDTLGRRYKSGSRQAKKSHVSRSVRPDQTETALSLDPIYLCALLENFHILYSQSTPRLPRGFLGFSPKSNIRRSLLHMVSGMHWCSRLQGYLAHKKLHPPLGPLYDPRNRPSVGS